MHISKKSSNFAANSKGTTILFYIMAQETLNGLLQYLVATLTYDNRAWLAQHLLEPEAGEAVPYTIAEIDARLDEAERDAATGKLYSTEQVFSDHTTRVTA